MVCDEKDHHREKGKNAEVKIDIQEVTVDCLQVSSISGSTPN